MPLYFILQFLENVIKMPRVKNTKKSQSSNDMQNQNLYWSTSQNHRFRGGISDIFDLFNTLAQETKLSKIALAIEHVKQHKNTDTHKITIAGIDVK